MDLTNRDIAFLVWMAVAAVAVLARPRGRKAMTGILRALRGKVALILVVEHEVAGRPTATLYPDVARHLAACPDCGQDRDALASLVRLHEKG